MGFNENKLSDDMPKDLMRRIDTNITLQMILLHFSAVLVFETHFNIVLLSLARFSDYSPFNLFPHQNSVCLFLLPHLRNISTQTKIEMLTQSCFISVCISVRS
jgi:hypothetical protein